MLSKNKIFFTLFVFVLLIQPLAPKLFKPADELMLFLFLLFVALDMAVNRDFRRYKSLFVLEGVFGFYFIFTVLFRDFNTAGAALNDFILQQKAFVPFLLAYAIAPQFTTGMKQVLKALCVAMAFLLAVIFVTGLTKLVLGHVYHLGTISMSVSMLYLFCSLDEDGKVSQRDFVVAIALLSVGLMSTRAKFYGEYVMALFMFFIYRPGMVRKMTFKHAAVLALGFVLVIVVAWAKIKLYFITGVDSNTFVPEVMETLARPVLYATMFLVFMDFPVFGSGLASFATHSSSPFVNYSDLYYDYGINVIWGLSPQHPNFISDAYFPELAQFGIVGVALFIAFWAWVWRKLRLSLHLGRSLEFSIGVIVVCFVMIESTSGATILQAGGYIPMMVLGMLVSKYRKLDKQDMKTILSKDYIQN